MQKPTAVLLLLLAGACAGSSLQWVKDGADAEDFRRDQATCLNRAGNFDFLSPGRGDNMEPRGTMDRSRGSLYRSCLEAMGYRQMRVESGKTQ